MSQYHYSCLSCRVTMINGHAAHESDCNDIFQIKRYGREYGLFQPYRLDVWGNKRDGYEVNDRTRYGRPILIPLDNDRDIIRTLKSHNMVDKRCHFGSFEIDGDDLCFYVSLKGEPIYQFERL